MVSSSLWGAAIVSLISYCSCLLGCVGLRLIDLRVFFVPYRGRGSPGIPFLLYPVGCCEGRAGLVVCVSSPLRSARVHGLRCEGMLLRIEASGRQRGSPRTRFVVRWGPPPVSPSLCHVVFVVYSRCFCPRGRGLYLRLPLCVVLVSV